MNSMNAMTLVVPDAISFEQAIALTENLLTQLATGQMTEAEAATVITQLVQTENGARGLFVTYLPDPGSIADNPSPELIAALRSSPAIVAELMVKNLVMSTAMVIYHQRQQSVAEAEGSRRVQSRSVHLLKALQLPEVDQRAREMLTSLTTGDGPYQAFLERWGYDAEQKQAMAEILQTTIAASTVA